MKTFLFVLLCLISLSVFAPTADAACPNQAQQFQLVPVRQRAVPVPVNNNGVGNNINIVNQTRFGLFGRRQSLQAISIGQNPGLNGQGNINIINGRRR